MYLSVQDGTDVDDLRCAKPHESSFHHKTGELIFEDKVDALSG